MTPPRRQTATRTTRVLAECSRCSWRSSSTNALGPAARHHDASGHHVVITVERVIEYGDAAAQIEGQGSLLELGHDEPLELDLGGAA